MADYNLQEIEQFLYREVRLLDNRQFHEWLELLTDDVRYWMPLRSSRYAPISKSIASLDEAHQEARELTGPHELVVMDETMDQPAPSHRTPGQRLCLG